MARRVQARAEDIYKDKLDRHLSVEERHESLVMEIHKETAQTLGRAAAKVEAAIEEITPIVAALETAPEEERPALEEAYEAARQRAERARLDLRITREAIGLLDNRNLARLYPIPPRRTAL